MSIENYSRRGATQFIGIPMIRQAWSPTTKIVLLVLLGTGVFILKTGWSSRIKQRESVLRQELQTMRMAIVNFTQDGQRPLESLQTLVDEKYLPAIPINPFTGRADWIPHYANVEQDDRNSGVCIDNVHASAPYDDW
jgi:general secretion pathway protein G